MKRLFLGILVVFWLTAGVFAQNSLLEKKAQDFVDTLNRQEFFQAVENFDKSMKQAFPASKLENIWKKLMGSIGPFKKQEGVRTEELGASKAVFVLCHFEKGSLEVKVVFDKKGQMAGLFFVPPAKPWEIPGYANKDTFREEDILFGKPGWELPGNLTIPLGSGTFPCIVLVHGSGPNDRDETCGFSRPFKDLAYGLTSRDIAVLRYEKRTRKYHEKCAAEKQFTVWQETVEDAVEAVSFLKKRSDIDPKRIFVLGHSLGGHMMPGIARDCPDAAGFIICAGPVRPLEDLMIEQLEYIFSRKKEVSVEEKAYLEKVKQAVPTIKSFNRGNVSSFSNIIGAPPYYWMTLSEYKPLDLGKQINRPLLILQGERDYQVTVKEFQLWKEALKGNPNVTFFLFPTLNHLFIKGVGESTPEEYQKPGHVDEEVIGKISEWLGKKK
ncbi:MAG: DUF3887 domain-containing protein [Candidatus Riflebacteria bacterium]|nr:DUF3887 domain-containing protein [Candidatus Riflebacteria bacterium]